MNNKGTIINDPFKYQRDVEFFLRLHRHLPDQICGGSPTGPCFYRADGKAINELNGHVEVLSMNEDFVRKESEVYEAVLNGIKLFNQHD